MGVWIACGTASSFKCSLTGSPVIVGSGWCGHWLKDDDLKVFNNHCFSLGRLSGVGSKGSCIGLAGVMVLLGHLQTSIALAARDK